MCAVQIPQYIDMAGTAAEQVRAAFRHPYDGVNTIVDQLAADRLSCVLEEYDDSEKAAFQLGYGQQASWISSHFTLCFT